MSTTLEMYCKICIQGVQSFNLMDFYANVAQISWHISVTEYLKNLNHLIFSDFISLIESTLQTDKISFLV